MNEKRFFVYILSNRTRGTLYIGVTSDIVKRVWQHKEKEADGFTKRYGISKLIWFEEHDDAQSAISREKQLKKWNRLWKIRLIEEMNPHWRDLYDQIIQ